MHGPCAGTGPPPAHGLHWAARTPRLGYGASCPGTPPDTAPESGPRPAPHRPVTKAGATNGPSAAGSLCLHCRGCRGQPGDVQHQAVTRPPWHLLSLFSRPRRAFPGGRARGPIPQDGEYPRAGRATQAHVATPAHSPALPGVKGVGLRPAQEPPGWWREARGQGPPSSEPTHPEQARGTVVGCTRPRAGPWRRAGDPRPGGWLPGGCHPPPSGGKGGTGREQPAAGDWGPDTPGAPSSAPGPRPSAPAGKQRAACPSPAAVTYLATWPHSSVLAFPLTHPRLPSLPVIYKAAGA